MKANINPVHNENSPYIGKKYSRLTIIKYIGKVKTDPKYLCKCDCGVEKVISWKGIHSLETKSCGCLNRETISSRAIERMKPFRLAAFDILYKTYIQNAKNRGLLFLIDKEEFRKLTSSNCVYCGIEPTNYLIRKNMNGGYHYNGIDRVDNSIGYLIDNCVPCCGYCNKMKLAYSKEDFLNQVVRIYNHQFNNKQDG